MTSDNIALESLEVDNVISAISTLNDLYMSIEQYGLDVQLTAVVRNTPCITNLAGRPATEVTVGIEGVMSDLWTRIERWYEAFKRWVVSFVKKLTDRSKWYREKIVELHRIYDNTDFDKDGNKLSPAVKERLEPYARSLALVEKYRKAIPSYDHVLRLAVGIANAYKTTDVDPFETLCQEFKDALPDQLEVYEADESAYKARADWKAYNILKAMDEGLSHAEKFVTDFDELFTKKLDIAYMDMKAVVADIATELDQGRGRTRNNGTKKFQLLMNVVYSVREQVFFANTAVTAAQRVIDQLNNLSSVMNQPTTKVS